MSEEIQETKLKINTNFLKFKNLRFKNIMSFGNNLTEVKLDTNSSTIISGKNGNGKSTIVEALVFCLFGKPFRNINKPQLVNNINKGGLYTEIEFSAGGHEYLVKRGLKPTLFEIYRDDKLIDQNAGMSDYQEYLENNIMRMNFKTFIQIVVIGNASYTQFMQLKPAQRKEVVEQLLTLKIFSVMYDVLKTKISDRKGNVDLIKVKANSCEDKISFIEEKMTAYLNINKINIEEVLENIKAVDNETSFRNSSLEELNKKYKEIEDKLKLQKVENKNLTEEYSRKLEKYRNASAKAKAEKDLISSRLAFLDKNDICPSCNQTIDKEHVEKHKLEFKENYIKLKQSTDILIKVKESLDKQLININNKIQIVLEKDKELTKLSNEIHSCKYSLRDLQNQKSNLEKEVERFQKQEKISEETTSDLNILIETNKQLNIEKNSLINEVDLMSKAQSLLKDTNGIKSEVIKNYIPIINKIVNKYLVLLDMYINFELDNNFNEIITSTNFKEFSYNSFSEGEKFRIDFALLMAWREIAKLKNSCSCNLLFLDETLDSSLDMAGGDAANRLINDLTSDGISVFVISHRDVMIDNFNHSITINKVQGFSQIIENKA